MFKTIVTAFSMQLHGEKPTKPGNFSNFRLLSEIWLSVLKGNVAHVRFHSPCNVIIAIVFVFFLEENLTGPSFLLACTFVAGNMLIFILKVNLAHVRFISPFNVAIENAFYL